VPIDSRARRNPGVARLGSPVSDSPGAVLQVCVQFALTLACGAGLPRTDIQRKAHRRMQAGAENKFLMRVGVHRSGTCAPGINVVKLHDAFWCPTLDVALVV
jgi:hypothetical protein